MLPFYGSYVPNYAPIYRQAVYAPNYGFQDRAVYNPMIQSPVYPMAGYPMLAGYPNQRILPAGSLTPAAGTRNLIKFGNFLELNGLFEQVATATATAPVTTVKGNFNIQQNGILDVFSGSEAKFSMYIMSSTDLTGNNINGMNSKTALMGSTNWLVLTESGTVIGCSKTALQ